MSIFRLQGFSPRAREHNRGTSVTLPSSLLREVDRLDGNRSAFLERAAASYISKRLKSELDARDAAIFDRVADELNRQSDVLEFQGLTKQGLTKQGLPR